MPTSADATAHASVRQSLRVCWLADWRLGCTWCPSDALLSAVGIRFIGPFQLVFDHHGKRGSSTPSDAAAGDSAVPLVASSRYFYDPPEVTAIAAFPDATARHWGYFRDVPSDAPIAVVESDDRRGTPGGGVPQPPAAMHRGSN